MIAATSRLEHDEGEINPKLGITTPNLNGFDGSFPPIDLDSDSFRARRWKWRDQQGKPDRRFGCFLHRRFF